MKAVLITLGVLGGLASPVMANGPDPAPAVTAVTPTESSPVPENPLVLNTVEGEDAPDHEPLPTIPPVKSRAQSRFGSAYSYLKLVMSDRTDFRVFASITALQVRMVRDDEEETTKDPGEPKELRLAFDDGIVMGQLNAGYYLEPYLQVIGSMGVFIEADFTDLQGASDYGRFGYGLFLTGAEGFALGKYINPVLAFGYRRQEDILEEIPGYGTLLHEVQASDVTNFFVSLNIKIPISCLLDSDVCKEMPN